MQELVIVRIISPLRRPGYHLFYWPIRSAMFMMFTMFMVA